MPRRARTTGGAPRRRAVPFRWRLVVMVKMPEAGRVKTRLAAGFGVATAVRFARTSTATLLRRLATDARWSTAVAVTPDAGRFDRSWPRCLALDPQGRGDLGARMQRIFERAGPGPVAIVGTDVPDMTRGHVVEAFRLLGRHDAVFGPAVDGGYWLVGMKRRPHVLRPFGGVRWSSAHALADTLANLRGRSVAHIAQLSDVDSPQDFARCAGRLGRLVRHP